MAQAKQFGKYHKDWASIAKQIKDEAEWKCVRCGHDHDVSSGHVLTVHHLDGNRENNERYNLPALCQRCHLSVQARVNPMVRIMFDPSIWAMPYIAGWYSEHPDLAPATFDLVRWVQVYETSGKAWPSWISRGGLVVPS